MKIFWNATAFIILVGVGATVAAAPPPQNQDKLYVVGYAHLRIRNGAGATHR